MKILDAVVLGGEIERNAEAKTTFARGVLASRDGTTRISIESSNPEFAAILKHSGHLSLELARVDIDPNFGQLVRDVAARATAAQLAFEAAFAAGDAAAKNPPLPPTMHAQCPHCNHVGAPIMVTRAYPDAPHRFKCASCGEVWVPE